MGKRIPIILASIGILVLAFLWFSREQNERIDIRDIPTRYPEIDRRPSPANWGRDKVESAQKLISAGPYKHEPSMHGSAVASIAVGKTVGLAPEAKLHYIATWVGDWMEFGEFDHNFAYYAQAVRRIRKQSASFQSVP